MSPILFIHGWGFGPEIWRHVAALVDEYAFVDLGFRGEYTLPQVEKPIIVGHSMGFAWALANLQRPWAGAIAINAFPRFTRTDDFPHGLQLRPLERMRTQFAVTPAETTAAFLSRCGLSDPDVSNIRPEPLAASLTWLTQCDERPALAALHCPLLALAGECDPLIPPAMSQASFAGHSLDMIPEGGHLLPLTHPQRIAAALAELRS